MSNFGLGETISELQKRIQSIKADLDDSSATSDIPELINSTNLLRSNEYFKKVNQKQADLLFAYAQYSESLEKILDTVFDIQNDLKAILREQSALISTPLRKSSKSTSRKFSKNERKIIKKPKIR